MKYQTWLEIRLQTPNSQWQSGINCIKWILFLKDMKKSLKTSRKTVLITGATGGIGKAIAVQFAKKGWDVVCHHRAAEEDAAALKKEVEKFF